MEAGAEPPKYLLQAHLKRDTTAVRHIEVKVLNREKNQITKQAGRTKATCMQEASNMTPKKCAAINSCSEFKHTSRPHSNQLFETSAL